MEDETMVETGITDVAEAEALNIPLSLTDATDGEIEATKVVEQIETNMPVYSISVNKIAPSGIILEYPADKLVIMLDTVAKKLKRPVNFCVYEKFEDIEFGVDGKVINIYMVMISPDDEYTSGPQVISWRIHLDGKYIDGASNSQQKYMWDTGISRFMDNNQEIRVNKDGSGVIIAGVNNNNLVVTLNCLCEDNQAAQDIFMWILNKAIPLFEFSDDAGFSDRLIKKFCAYYSQMVKSRRNTVEIELETMKNKANEARYTINRYESERPVIEKELNYLQKLVNINGASIFRKQVKSLLRLMESGRFIDIRPMDTGVVAVTNQIKIEYDDYVFDMGQYEIDLRYDDFKNPIIFKAYGRKPNWETNYLHPHILPEGEPCFGELGSTPYTLCTTMRVNELLELLYEFLCSYNPDNPFVKIGMFDVDGDYHGGESDDPCDDCSDYGTPYCVKECSNNNSNGDIECSEWRSRFCYLECEYKDDCDLSPCDDCDEDDDYCFDGCEYNEDWQWKNACRECANDVARCKAINAEREPVEGEESDGEEQERCPYYEKACELGCNPS